MSPTAPRGNRAEQMRRMQMKRMMLEPVRPARNPTCRATTPRAEALSTEPPKLRRAQRAQARPQSPFLFSFRFLRLFGKWWLVVGCWFHWKRRQWLRRGKWRSLPLARSLRALPSLPSLLSRLPLPLSRPLRPLRRTPRSKAAPQGKPPFSATSADAGGGRTTP